MSKRQPELLIEDIIESGAKIFAYTESLSFDEFISDDKTVDAVIRNFEIIGEAASYFDSFSGHKKPMTKVAAFSFFTATIPFEGPGTETDLQRLQDYGLTE